MTYATTAAHPSPIGWQMIMMCLRLIETQGDGAAHSEKALEDDLRRAVRHGHIDVHYQPQADLATGDIVGVEALARWTHPRLGLLSPDSFIDLAERAGLIKPLSLHVLDKALEQGRRWRDEGLDLRIAANLSASTLLDTDLPDEVFALLSKWSMPAESVVLEITESTLMSDPLRAMEVVHRLSTMGLTLAIDDFGTGYSSLSHLRRLPLKEIKIDRSFVMAMTEDENDAVIVRSMIELGRNLGLRVVAEGVESIEAWNILRELRCDVAQGYFLSEALTGVAVSRWLAGRVPVPA